MLNDLLVMKSDNVIIDVMCSWRILVNGSLRTGEMS